jgi:hypothetical protein
MDILDSVNDYFAEEEAAEKLTLNRIGFEPRPLLWHTIKQYVRFLFHVRLPSRVICADDMASNTLNSV